MNHFKKIILLFIISLHLLSIPLFAKESGNQSIDQEKKSSKKTIDGFLDFNGYYDTRDFSIITINALANFPYRFQYFSLTNFFSDIGDDNIFDLDSFYSEQNIRWSLSKKSPLDLTLQGVFRSGNNNDLMRSGIRWRLNNTKIFTKFFKKINVFYSINFHLLQTNFEDEINGWQIEHVYRINLFPKNFDNRVYLTGFADHNMTYLAALQGNNHYWVTEHQLGIKLISELYAVFEYRYNEYLRSRKNGFGLGLEYKINFKLD
jgi:hypothetical protein